MASFSEKIRSELNSKQTKRNPWICVNPRIASILLIISFFIVLILDSVIILYHWTSGCSYLLKTWIIGKYIMPILSYLSFLLFMPCNKEETIEIIMSIPYTKHELRKYKNNNICTCINIRYPYDILLSEWFESPSLITNNIALTLNENNKHLCKIYTYTIGIIFDRGVLEIIWLFIGGICLVNENISCKLNHPILYFYVTLQVILGIIITILIIFWMIISTFCPLSMARCMSMCYEVQCDILGFCPTGYYKNLINTQFNYFTNNNSILNANYNSNNNNNINNKIPIELKDIKNKYNFNYNDYITSNEYNDFDDNSDVELLSSNNNNNNDINNNDTINLSKILAIQENKTHEMLSKLENNEI
mmetsp:Transcript_43250/g.53122  ORF Transcript_43250/g.53122 Transcript_43250/m.53122 type:complete len:361 (-) Transcript_43250:13-1095(-)